MHGNVCEWCGDWFGKDYYKVSPGTDPPGPRTGSHNNRATRDTPWAGDDPEFQRAALRCTLRGFYGTSHAGLGFRVVCQIPDEPAERTRFQVGPATGPPDAVPQAIAPFDATQAKKHQQAWADHLGLPVERTNSIGMKLALVPPGEFTMGSSAEEIAALVQEAERLKLDWCLEDLRGEGPQHRVRLARPLLIGKHEVSVDQFRAFVEATGYKTAAESDGIRTRGYDPAAKKPVAVADKYDWKNPGFTQTGEHPVCVVSLRDAEEFCKWLSGLESRNYRLPTEAEWEYACRAGTETRSFAGSRVEDLAGTANLPDESLRKLSPAADWIRPGCSVPWDDGYPFTAPVGEFRPNAFGLCDMIGNVAEWCRDWYDRRTYRQSEPVDPKGPASGQSMVLRGGTWDGAPLFARSANRGPGDPRNHQPYIGFRVVCEVASPGAGQEESSAGLEGSTP